MFQEIVIIFRVQYPTIYRPTLQTAAVAGLLL